MQIEGAHFVDRVVDAYNAAPRAKQVSLKQQFIDLLITAQSSLEAQLAQIDQSNKIVNFNTAINYEKTHEFASAISKSLYFEYDEQIPVQSYPIPEEIQNSYLIRTNARKGIACPPPRITINANKIEIKFDRNNFYQYNHQGGITLVIEALENTRIAFTDDGSLPIPKDTDPENISTRSYEIPTIVKLVVHQRNRPESDCYTIKLNPKAKIQGVQLNGPIVLGSNQVHSSQYVAPLSQSHQVKNHGITEVEVENQDASQDDFFIV